MSSAGGSSQARTRQGRTGQWRGRERLEALTVALGRRRSGGHPSLSKAAEYGRSALKNLRKSQPTNEDLVRAANREYTETTKGYVADRFRRKAPTSISFQRKQDRKIKDLVKDWSKGGHGWVPALKPDGTIRVTFENLNSLKYWTEKKRDRIRKK